MLVTDKRQVEERWTGEGGDKCSVTETWTKLDIVKNSNFSENLTKHELKRFFLKIKNRHCLNYHITIK